MEVKIELSEHELHQLGQALSYAIINAKTESETAEFAMLKVKIEGEIVRHRELKNYIDTIKSLEVCPFKYCDSNPKCTGKCRYA